MKWVVNKVGAAGSTIVIVIVVIIIYCTGSPRSAKFCHGFQRL